MKTTQRLLRWVAQGACLFACSSELRDASSGPEIQPFGNGSSPPLPGSSANSGAPVFGDVAEGVAGYSGAQACAEFSAGAEASPAVLQLVVDTSGSMNDAAPGMRESKWEVTRSALLGAIDGMPDSVALGVIFYPNVPQNAEPCFDRQTAVPIDLLGAPGSAHRAAIEQAFASKLPDGGTPTHDAYQYALSEVRASPAPGRRFVVLITDGVPTFSLGCVAAGGFGPFQRPVDTAPLVGEAATALSTETRTFVIGSPGSEDGRESLSRIAEAGGTAKAACSDQGPSYCHFDMTTESDLASGLGSALSTIVGTALSCDYAVPPAPGGSVLDPTKVNLLFTPEGGSGELIAQSNSAACSEGWQYTESLTHLHLCPGTCERVRSSQGQVTLQFGCVTVVR